MISRKTIIISVCLIILLVGTYLFLNLSGNNQQDVDKPKQEVVSTQLEPIFEASPESIQSLNISAGDMTYEFYKTDEGWKVQGFENIVFNQANVNSTIFDYVKLTPMLVVDEAPADTALYGFDKPIAISEVKTFNGGSAKFYLGNQTKGGNGYYFMKDGDPAVYTVSTVLGNNMQKALIEYRDKTLVDFNVEDVTEVTMTVQGVGEVNIKKLEEQMDIITSWSMTKPYDIGVYDDKLAYLILEPMKSVQIQQFVSDNPTANQLIESGLDNPTYFYEIKTSDKTYKILIGKNFDGYFIVKRDDLPSVCLVNSDYFNFLFTDIFEYIHSYVYLPDRTTISGISCEASGNNYNITLTADADNEKLFVNDKQVKKDQFTDFYKEFFGVPIKGHVTKPAENPDNVFFSYNVTRTDGIVDKISFVNMNSKYMYIYVNGKNEFYVYAEDVNKAVTALKNLAEQSNQPYIVDEAETQIPSQDSAGFNWIALLIVVAIIALIAVFPLSILKGNKNKK